MVDYQMSVKNSYFFFKERILFLTFTFLLDKIIMYLTLKIDLTKSNETYNYFTQ